MRQGDDVAGAADRALALGDDAADVVEFVVAVDALNKMYFPASASSVNVSCWVTLIASLNSLVEPKSAPFFFVAVQVITLPK